MRKDVDRKYSSIIQLIILMFCISSVCVAGVVEYTDEATFKNDTGNPQYFIDFESYGDGIPMDPGDQAVTGDEWLNLGIQFSEMEVGFSMILSAKPGMNVSPTNDPGHALAIAGLSPGNDRSSFLITFQTPVISFGVYIVDNETGGPGAYPMERIILKDEDGNIIGDFAMPGGAGPAPPLPFAQDFIGYSSTIPIAEVHFIEANDGEGALLDNVMYSFPEPVEVELVLIPGGEFEMGDHHDGMGDAPVHAVYVDSFYMSRHEITNQQYCDFLNSALSEGLIEVRSNIVYAAPGGTDPYCNTQEADPDSRISFSSSTFTVVTGKENHPMVEVSWYGAAAYCNYYDYRLPTEAEWEYAARGGEYNPYYRHPWGDNVDGSKANYVSSGDPFDNGTTPVGYYDGSQIPSGTDMANGYGLYDMAGNVWEWCNDWYSSTYYSSSPPNNPTGPTSGTYRVVRGGCWLYVAVNCRLALRGLGTAGRPYQECGFRVARNADVEMEWVTISEAGFTGQMSKYETTNAQYCQFLNAALSSGDITVSGDDVIGANGSNGGEDFVGQVYYNLDGPGGTNFGAINGGAARIDSSGGLFTVEPGFEDHPVNHVSWYGATAFCNYYGYRLPDMWEWRAVADYDGTYIYGCGTSINTSIANYQESIHPDGTTVVGSFGTYGYGMCDMTGNLWELTSTIVSGGNQSVICGTSWWEVAYNVSFTTNANVYTTSREVGFRAVRDLEPCWQEQEKLLADDGAAGDEFGNSVAISGNTAIVGAAYDNDAGSKSGSAYLYDVVTGNQLAKLTASDAAADNRFGVSVSVSGDYAIVGSYRDDDKGYWSGSAYIFEKPIDGWVNMTETVKLTASDGATGDLFGNSVSISGDYAIVGAYVDDDNGTDSGSVYIFKRFGESWVEQQPKLLASDGAAGDLFGYSVSISGSIAIVGAWGNDDAGSYSGSAYLFDMVTGGQIAKLTASDAAAGDYFGSHVALSGNIAIVGAGRDDNAGSDSGSAYIFEKPIDGWVNMTETAKLTASDAAAEDYFGSVDISGNIAIVGAHWDDDNGSTSGSAYLFDVSDPCNPIEIDKITASDADAWAYFGTPVAISGNTAIIGAIGDDDNGSLSGSAYVFENICEPVNTAPVAICQNVTVAADGNCEGVVTAEDVNDGSFDPDGDLISFSIDPCGPYPLGDTVVMLTVSDGVESDTCEATVTVVDTTAPVVSVGDMAVLWPANHKYREFKLSDLVVSVDDACGGLLDVDAVGTIVSIYSDEPEDAKGNGDGETTDDIVILGASSFKVRSERAGGGNGRVYGVTFEVVDAAGNVSVGTCYVGAAHDQSGDGPVDDGAGAGYAVP